MTTVSIDGSDLKFENVNTSYTINITPSNSTTGSYSLTLPIDDGSSGQFLSTNGTGVLSWNTPAGSGDVVGPGSATDNAITRFDGTTGKLIQNSIVIIDDSGNITGGTWNGGVISPTYGGTGVNNGSNTLTLGGSLTTSGAFGSTFTMSGTTAVTFPTSGTLATTSQLPSGAALTRVDDTNVTLTLGGTPSSALLQASSISVGWSGILSPDRGGTGVNNGSNTLTLGGSLITSGAFASTFTMTGPTSVTFPTSGTLATTSTAAVASVSGTANRIGVSPTSGACVVDISSSYIGQSSITTLGTIVSGTWNGSVISAVYGGTAQSTYVLGDTLYSSGTNTLSKLPGNTTTAKQYLSQTGDGVNSAAPVWDTVSGGDVSGAALNVTNSDPNVSLSLSGTPSNSVLRTTTITPVWSGQLALTRGGTNNSLTPSNGGVVWSDSTKLNILSGTATANQILLSGSSATPTWSTATYPSTTTSNQMLYSSVTNTISGTSNMTYDNAVGLTISNTTATTSNTTGSIKTAGGIGISNTTDATSSTNGGTITTAGGAAIGKSLYVGSANDSYLIVTYLVVAGGGGGASGVSSSIIGGGGGAGGLLTASTSLTGSVTITVGNGGAGGTFGGAGSSGSNSSIGSTIIAIGGGGGGPFTVNGLSGGSGGGGGSSVTTGGSGTAGQGFSGGNGIGNNAGGGGGGSGAVGSNSGAGNTGGNGGNGTVSTISGSSVTYAGGGGGGGNSTPVATGGSGGGGSGGVFTGSILPGNATGFGSGGGGTYGGSAGSGSTGVVIISYTSASQLATGGTVTTSGGNYIHTFTTSGTFTVNPAAFNVAGGANITRTLTTTSLIATGPNVRFTGRPAFKANGGQATFNSSTIGVTTTLICANKIYDQDNGYNTSTGIFTANVTGIYHFSTVILITPSTNVKSYVVTFQTSNAIEPLTRPFQFGISNTQPLTLGGSASFKLNASETCFVSIYIDSVSGTPVSTNSQDVYTWFSGFLVA